MENQNDKSKVEQHYRIKSVRNDCGGGAEFPSGACTTRPYNFFMRAAVTFAFLIVCSCWYPVAAIAQGEKYGYEFTASYWPVTPSGNVLTHGERTDFRSDLGIRNRGLPMFAAVIKTAERHGFTVEFVPYRFDCENTLTKNFRFGGRTYSAQEKIHSEASINYFFGGYQYDLVRRDRGYLELVAGVAYFGASVDVQRQQFGSATEDRKLPLPIAGVKFRIFPFHGDTFNINGEVKGMSYGGFGRYIQPNVNATLAVSRHVRLQAGFNLVDADAHTSDELKGFKMRFAGPIFSVQLHD